MIPITRLVGIINQAGTAIVSGSSSYIPVISNAVTWTRYDVPPFPNSNMGATPYSGTKHSRWTRRTVDNCWYVLGGDYSADAQASTLSGGSGLNFIYKVTPGHPFVWNKLNTFIPTPGQKFPNRVDEAPWMYDSRRDRFLLFPNPRWTTTASADLITGHLMYYYPSTNTWQDLGTGIYTGGTSFDRNNNPQYDINGHQYPIDSCKWGVYDAVTDKYYIPQGSSSLMVLDAATLAMEWPIMNAGGTSPYTNYNQTFYTACLCFDTVRRRLVTLKSANNGDYTTDPNAYKLHCVDIDMVGGTRAVYTLPSTNFPFDPNHPLYIDFEALVHDQVNDIYILYGGAYTPGYATVELASNDMRILPATGGSWKKLGATGAEPPLLFGQTMHYDPTIAGFFELGGIPDDVTVQGPLVSEMWFPTLNNTAIAAAYSSNSPVSWVSSIGMNQWGAIPASNTLAAINPDNDPTANPNFPAQAPWRFAGNHTHMVTAWCGASFDDNNGVMWWVDTGGHGDNLANGVYKLDLNRATPLYTRVLNPSGSVGYPAASYDITPGSWFRDNHALMDDGRPRAKHTVNFPFYWPGRGPGLASEILIAPSGGTEPGRSRPYIVSESTGQVTFTGANNPNYAGSYESVCYDSIQNVLWKVKSSGGGYFSKWGGPANDVWTDVGVDTYYFPDSVSLCHSPSLNLILVGNGGDDQGGIGYQAITGGFGILDPVTGTFYAKGMTTTYPTFTGAPTTAPAGFATGLWAGTCQPRWSARLGAFLAWDNSAGSTTQVMKITPPTSGDPRTGTWTISYLTVSPTNTITPSAAVATGTYGRFFLWDSLGICGVVNSVNETGYFFRYA